RDFQTAAGQPPQVSVMSPILVGTDGTRRMGKSLGNYIGLAEDAYAQTKKFMQLPDEVMRTYFTLLTDVAFEEVDALLAGHPKEAKLRLAAEVCAGYHGAEAAKQAGDRWQREIGGGGLPADIPEIVIPAGAIAAGKIPPGTLLVAMKFCSSNGEARRLVQQGGMKLGEGKTPHTDFGTPIEVADGLLVWAGKKKFARIKLG
ncbi:MAG: tyrosine--tRNA ligase, partial [Planctomycetota bacterium]